ncbi:MAG: VanW family protein [Lachnospiraceae bacterium]
MTVRKILQTITILSVMICTSSFFTENVYAKGGFHIFGGAATIGVDDSDDNEDAQSGQGNIVIDFEVAPKEQADLSGTISAGVFVGAVDVSGMTYDEAKSAVTSYVTTLRTKEITLVSTENNQSVVTAGELGADWANEDVLADAISLGKSGNLVSRYKSLKDLEQENKVYPLELKFDGAAIQSVVEKQGELYNVEAVDATMTRENGSFSIAEGQTGHVINVDASVNQIADTLASWNGENMSVQLQVDVDEPRGKTEDLQKVKDLLGTCTTSFSSSGYERSGNVRNGTRLLNGILLYPGDSFSAYEMVNPFTEENGYYLAGSYLNGMVVESLGGGICQVTSTLYNAVIRAELQIDERFNHSMIVTYVQLSSDAAISGTSKDFKFTNNSEYPIYIEGNTTENKKITFNIYGVETRPSNRTVEFESVELSRTEPTEEKIIADAGQPVGYISVQSAHTGYVGELWKVVKVDGVETERTRMNKSTYAVSPRTATIGTAAADPAIVAAIQAAIATNNIDYCKNVIAQLNAAAAAVAAGTAQ